MHTKGTVLWPPPSALCRTRRPPRICWLLRAAGKMCWALLPRAIANRPFTDSASRCDDRMFIPLASLPNRMISRQRFVEQSRELKIAAALRVSASTRASVWRLSPSSLATAKHTMLQPRERRRSSKSCRWLHERVLFATSCVPAPLSQKNSFS